MKQQKITHPISRILLFLAIITIGSTLNGQLQASTPEVPEVAITAPTAYAASTITYNSFFASWKSVPGATSYKIYVSRRVLIGFFYQWMVVTSYNGLSVGGANITVSGLLSGSTYKYSVTAMQLTDESVHSNEIQILTLCEAPVANAATNVTPVSLTANWSSVTGATSYKIYMIDATENYIYNGVSVTGTSINATGLTSNKLYRYRVSAVNATGDSEKSNIINATTLTADPPVASNASSITAATFRANWGAKAGATSYLLRVVDDETQDFVLLDFEITGTSYVVTGLKSNSGYRYSVKAKYGSNVSALSNWITLSTEPSPPTANSATNVTTTSFTANWSAVAGATGYHLWVWSNSSSEFSPVGYTPKSLGNVTSHNLTGLQKGHSYSYFVQVNTANGISTASNTIIATTKPDAPTATNATTVTSSSFRANWNSVSGATSYLLRVVDQVTQEWIELDREVEGTSYTVSNLMPSREYSYSLKAKKGDAISDIGNWIYVTTAVGEPPVATAASNITSSSFHANWNSRAGATSYLLRVVDQVTQEWIELDKEVTGTSYSVTNLTPNREYSYSLKAKYGNVTTGIGNWIYVTTSNNPVVTYTLSFSSSPALAGTLSGGGTFASGASVTAHAAPSAGYSFVNWTENGSIVSTSASYAFTITSNRTLVANFAQQIQNFTVTSTASPVAGGSTNIPSATYPSGQSVTLTAAPTLGYSFANWTESGVQVSTSASYTFTVNANRNLVANFSKNSYQITSEAQPLVGGTTNIVSAQVLFGESISLSATPITGYSFVNWTADGTIVSTSSDYTFTVEGNRNLIANFAIQKYTVSSEANPSDGGTTSIANSSFNYGETVTISAIPNEGYDFVNWTRGGTEVSTLSNYSFVVSEDVHLIANFRLKTFTITLSSNPSSGGFTNFASSNFSYGQNVTINANANANNKFINWTENGIEISDQLTHTFIAVENRSIVANFELLNEIDDQKLQEVKMFPNPTSGNVFLTGVANICSVKLVTLTGNVMKEMIPKKNEIEISVNDVRKGVYLIMIESEKGTISKKLIVQ